MIKKIVIALCFVILFIAILTVPFEKVIGYRIIFWVKLILLLLFLSLALPIRGFKHKYWLMVSALIAVLGSRTISDRLFLGRQIGYVYHGEDAGFLELSLFSNTNSRINYGGILGTTDVKYGSYRLQQDSSVRINCNCRILELNGLHIEIAKIKYLIKPN